MSANWPGDWYSKTDDSSFSGVSLTNDNGILCLTGTEAEEYLFVGDIPPELENRP